MKAKYITGSELELIPDLLPEIKSTWFPIKLWLSKIWNLIIDALTKEPELQIREVQDGAGNIWWYIYDPTTDRAAWLDSKNEVRIWIEKNYR
ncbi:hypothetical protein [Leptothermofonsia sp. ETS-13]|uniref:hypothetical protein n=1 Tax=Leptothermofonsia sp. ETS-13 TaxID=3035696 RepID=UPI003BA25774